MNIDQKIQYENQGFLHLRGVIPPDMVARLKRAYHLNPSQALAEVIRRVETQGVQSLYRR